VHRLAPGKRAQLVDELRAAHQGALGHRHRLANALPFRPLGLDDAQARRDDVQQVGEIVAHAACEVAERLQLLRLHRALARKVADALLAQELRDERGEKKQQRSERAGADRSTERATHQRAPRPVRE